MKKQTLCPNCDSNDVMKRIKIAGSALIHANTDRPEQPLLVDWSTVGRPDFLECRDCGNRW